MSNLRDALDARQPDALRDAIDAARGVHRITLRCRRCGTVTELPLEPNRAAGVQPFDVRCTGFCGARARGSAHWPLGRNGPVLVFDQKSEVVGVTG